MSIGQIVGGWKEKAKKWFLMIKDYSFNAGYQRV